MSPQRVLLIIILCFTFASGCRKQSSSPDCRELKDKLSSNNVEEVKTSLTKFIDQLSSKTYTEENLNKLVKLLSDQCDISATVLCFDCIQTLPGQTEINITLNSLSGSQHRIIDISSWPDNKMRVVNMHD